MGERLFPVLPYIERLHDRHRRGDKHEGGRNRTKTAHAIHGSSRV